MFPVGSVGEFLFASFEKVKDYLGLGNWLSRLVEDGCGRLDLAQDTVGTGELMAGGL